MLFESPTQIRQRLYQNAYQMGAPIMGGGLFAPAYQGIGKIGTGLGAMVGSSMNPEVKRAQAIQGIQKEVFADMQPEDFPSRLPTLAGKLASQGYTGEAIKVLGYSKELNKSSGMAGFDDKKQYLDAEKAFRAETDKALEAPRMAIQFYNDTAKLKGGNVNKWTGTDDFVAIRNLIKQSLPNEAVMSDDKIEAKLAAGGYPGWIQNIWAALTGRGAQAIPARKEILTTMQDVASIRVERRDKIRAHYGKLASDVGFDPDRIMMEAQELAPLNFTNEKPKSDYGNLTPAEIKELQELEKELGQR